MCLTITQPDSVCNSKEYEYAVLRAFLVKIVKGEDGQESTEIVKTSYFGRTYQSHIETRLEAGEYKLLFDVDCQATEFGRNFVTYSLC